MHLNVKGRSVLFLIDCGASCNLLLLEDAVAIDPELKSLRKTDTRLTMFDGTELKTRGVLTARVKHPISGKRRLMQFYVAETHNRAILGVDACQDLDLITVNYENICTVHGDPKPSSSSSALRRVDKAASPSCLTESEVIAQYPDLFEGVGLLEGEVHFDVDESVPPVQMPLRRLPLGVRDKVAAELRRLEQDGIIAPVTDYTPWVSALLAVSKPDGRLRLCIDAKPVNRVLRRAPHYMTTVDDVLPQLADVKVFSSCDVKEAFFHMKLDKQSSRLTTFATPFGRYRWLRCPFGVSPAPEL